MKTDVVMISPEMAERYLKRNLNNRPLSLAWSNELSKPGYAGDNNGDQE